MTATDSPPGTMPAERTSKPVHRLTLRSQLGDLALLWPWVEALAAEYSISSETTFAIHLCLEEAVSNVIRHGYGGQPNHTLAVSCASPAERKVEFTIEDQAPPFDPLAHAAAAEPSPPSSIEELRPGGRGLHLLRTFAGSLAYERTSAGNRLTIAFVLA
jgi:serine/threonine-protein kinase RsbW